MTDQGWTQIVELAIALALSALIGSEREVRQKSAGLRTHTLVGFAAALIMLVSKYGFGDVLGPGVTLDPSRIAAQIVSGIGFIGGGLIFVRRDSVRGLTTAASIWLTAGIGMAAGAGLWLLAMVATVGHFLVVFALTPLAAVLRRTKYALAPLRLSYRDAQGVLRRALAVCTARGFAIAELELDQNAATTQPSVVSVRLTVQGRGSVTELATALLEVDGVLTVSSEELLVADA